MANFIYDKARQSFAKAEINLATDTIKACLVRSSTYTPDSANDQYLSSISSVVATSSAFTSPTTTAGVFDAADITFTAVAAGAAIQYLVIYQDTGNSATSRLIACMDTGTGMPVTPNGTDINIVWAASSPNIFKL